MACLLLFCFGALLLCHAEAKPRSPPPPPATPSADHFWLVHSWPKGYCSDPSVTCEPSTVRDSLTIHGWWPVDNNGYTLTDCQNFGDITHLFDGGVVANDFYNEMTDNWPNLLSPTKDKKRQIGFWKHEMDFHGSCSKFIPKTYFEKTLSLKTKIDISQVLRVYRIVPGAVYQRSAFEKAIEKKIGTTVFAMRCIEKNGAKILSEIIICTKIANAIPCSQRNDMSRDNCGNGLIKFVSKVERV